MIAGMSIAMANSWLEHSEGRRLSPSFPSKGHIIIDASPGHLWIQSPPRALAEDIYTGVRRLVGGRHAKGGLRDMHLRSGSYGRGHRVTGS